MSRIERLRAALARGDNMSQFARDEGVSPQAISNWLVRRPDLQASLGIAKLRKQRSDATFSERVEAIRLQKSGTLWKIAAWQVRLSGNALNAWYHKNRAAVDAALAESERLAA
jgi:transposase-like protein